MLIGGHFIAMQPQQACLCTQMANSTPASKKMKFTSPTHTVSDQKALDIIHTAQGIPFPWKEAVPEEISDWFHTLAKSHNTAPEFLFCGCLTTVATLMGPLSSVKVRETYSERTNLYLVCVAEPGVGKTQAIRLSVLDPLSAIGPPLMWMITPGKAYLLTSSNKSIGLSWHTMRSVPSLI